MDAFHIAVLIRSLFALAMFVLLVSAGMLFGRLDKAQSTRAPGEPTANPVGSPNAAQRTRPYSAKPGQVEANDPALAPVSAEKRAA